MIGKRVDQIQAILIIDETLKNLSLHLHPTLNRLAINRRMTITWKTTNLLDNNNI